MSQEASSAFGKFGIEVGSVSVNVPTMQSYKDKIVTGLTQGIEGLFKKNKVEHVKVRLHLVFLQTDHLFLRVPDTAVG